MTRSIRITIAAVLVAIAVAHPSARALAEDLKCNGHAELCDRRYDEVVYATTHNSMSNLDEGWQLPNQRHGLQRQLDDGIRGFMLDVYYKDGDTLMCHSVCLYGHERLADGLAKIRKHLDENAGDVVTILFENYAPPEAVAKAFEESGAIKYVVPHKEGEQWPTLREMSRTGKRLVVFTGNGGAYPWYLDVEKFTWGTTWDVHTKKDFTCKANYGDTHSSLFVLNHMLTWPFVSEGIAKTANANPFFINSVKKCLEETGKLPNFIVVDYYSVGDIFSVVDEMNGVAGGVHAGAK